MWIPQNVVNHVIGKDKLTKDFEVVECLPCQDFSIKMVDCLISVGSDFITSETLSKENAASWTFKTFSLILMKNIKREN